MQNERNKQRQNSGNDDGNGDLPGANLGNIRNEFSTRITAGQRALRRAQSRDAVRFLQGVQQEGGQ